MIVVIAIGAIDKSMWKTLLGAPIAVSVGIILGVIAWSIGLHPVLIIFGITLLGVTVAVFVRRPRSKVQCACREIVEPIISGLLAGIASTITWEIVVIRRMNESLLG